MVVTVVGKEYVSGTSKKTGNQFEANVVHVIHRKNKLEGNAVDTIWLDVYEYPLSDIKVGEKYNIDRDARGFIVDFTICGK